MEQYRHENGMTSTPPLPRDFGQAAKRRLAQSSPAAGRVGRTLTSRHPDPPNPTPTNLGGPPHLLALPAGLAQAMAPKGCALGLVLLALLGSAVSAEQQRFARGQGEWVAALQGLARARDAEKAEPCRSWTCQEHWHWGAADCLRRDWATG